MTFLKTMGFSIVAMLLFTAFANILPQVQSDPPIEEEISTDGLDMAGMIAYGERLFTGKGTCTLCHNDLGRAPDLLVMDLATAFNDRLADPRNVGVSSGGEGASDVEAYLRESLIDPSAYVVEGFGKKGSNDTISPMPVVDAPPIELNEVELNAVIAFLQDGAGWDPTVPLPSAEDAVIEEEPEEVESAEPETDPLVVLDNVYCAGCHDLEGSEADVGPNLNDIGTRMTQGEIIEAILYPNAIIADGYEADYMPEDFGEQMHTVELMVLVDYLINLSN
jgi:mono/diheme cytochrome c family protein